MSEQTTIDDIVAHVEATEGWQLKATAIRRLLPDRRLWACPITSMRDVRSSRYAVVARQIGLCAGDTVDIGSAADIRHVEGSELYPLRRRLLAAAKLTEA